MIDYSFYQNNFYGNLIPMEVFDKYGNKATSILKSRIYNNIPNEYLNEVKMVCCEIAEILYNQTKIKESVSNGNITSERVGDYSITKDNSNMLSQSYVNGLIETELERLYYTGLVYTGVPIV